MRIHTGPFLWVLQLANVASDTPSFAAVSVTLNRWA